MTERSTIWNTTGTGDGPEAGFGIAQWGRFLAALGGGGDARSGVIPGLLNELRVTTDAADIAVATGWALVDGHGYENDAEESYTPTTPSVGTTGHRVVLRANWAAQTVRITDLASADGTAAIPAKTTTPGTTYDLDLASYTITTGGVVANLTDLRTFAGAPDQPARRAYTHRRRVFGEFSGTVGPPPATGAYALGVGFSVQRANNGLVASQTPDILRISSGSTSGGYAGIVSSAGEANQKAAIRPDQSPMMIIEVIPPAAAAALAAWYAGFFDGSTPTATLNGAMLRRVTTGNVFFVTRQGGSETTTDLGNITTRRQLIIESPDGGVTWNCIDAEDGSVLASHTDDVPTASTALAFGTAILNNTTTAVTADPAYMRVEADTL